MEKYCIESKLIKNTSNITTSERFSSVIAKLLTNSKLSETGNCGNQRHDSYNTILFSNNEIYKYEGGLKSSRNHPWISVLG